MKTLCFSGHRPGGLPWGNGENSKDALNFQARLYECVEEYINGGFTRFCCGMALGSDTFFAESVFQLKTRYPHIIFYAALPCRAQDEKWNFEQKIRYKNLLEEADEVYYSSAEYTADCMKKRNLHLAEIADRMLFVLNGRSGGTWQTYRIAIRLNKPCDIFSWQNGVLVLNRA